MQGLGYNSEVQCREGVCQHTQEAAKLVFLLLFTSLVSNAGETLASKERQHHSKQEGARSLRTSSDLGGESTWAVLFSAH